jgi:tellurite resistance protein TerC
MDFSVLKWVIFASIVLILLLLDLGVFNKTDHEIQVKESLYLSGFYVAIGLLFGGWIWYSMGLTSAQLYLTGYLIEKTLALDNIFVISLIFSYLSIPRIYQHRVLFWGILGVIVFRGIMIYLGAKIVSEFEWVLYIFAALLILTGIKMLFISEHKTNMQDNRALKFLQRHLRVTKELHGHDFFVVTKENNKTLIWCTPLFIALAMVEIADLIFAIDSVPAIFTITTDPYLVYTSNIFSILGLRALYFALAAILHRFVYLKYALSIVLIFIGSKVFIADWFGWVKFPAWASLSITFGLIAAGIIFSLYKTRGQAR